MSNNLIDFDKLVFNQKDILGEGHFGAVYKVTDGHKYDDRFVAKVFNTPKFLSMLNKLSYGVTFDKEIAALKYLGDKNISPKLFYIKDTYTSRYYVMEAMDNTLLEILEYDFFTREHLRRLNNLLFRIMDTPYRHYDLHTNNLMWSTKLDDFRIIDWGIYDLVNNISKGKYKMLMSGDIYVIIQLYIAYRLKENNSLDYWKPELDRFLTFVPKKEHVFDKYNDYTLNQKVFNGIEQYLKRKNNKTVKRKRYKTTNKTKNNRLRMKEAKNLLGEKTNIAFYEMNNL